MSQEFFRSKEFVIPMSILIVIVMAILYYNWDNIQQGWDNVTTSASGLSTVIIENITPKPGIKYTLDGDTVSDGITVSSNEEGDTPSIPNYFPSEELIKVISDSGVCPPELLAPALLFLRDNADTYSTMQTEEIISQLANLCTGAGNDSGLYIMAENKRTNSGLGKVTNGFQLDNVEFAEHFFDLLQQRIPTPPTIYLN